MSRTVNYKCDNAQCERNSNDIVKNEWIEIGSDNKSLAIFNYTKEARLMNLQRYDKVHFCSKKCLIDYLFV